MRLDAWLRKDPSLVDRLQVVERLAQAVNAAHERGLLLAGLEPSRIEVSGDGACDLDDALRGSPATGYRAPEREGDAPATTASDVYAAGTILWETLVGRPYASGPSHLSEARTDLPGDLADAVMACLERSPEWRPRDLAYVAELAQQAAAQRGRGSRAAAPKAAPSTRSERGKRSASARPSFEARVGSRDGSRSQGPLLIAAVLLLAAAAGGYYWMTHGASDAVAPVPVARGAATAAPGAPPIAPSAAPEEPTAPTPAPTTAAATPAAAPTPTVAPPPTAAPQPTPTPRTAPVSSAPSARQPAPEPAAPASTTAAAPIPTTAAPAPASAPAPEPAAPAQRAELATLSPLSVKRPGKVLFDLHGTGLTGDLQARFVAVRDAPRGLTVVRLKCSGTLCNVLVELDEGVKPAPYAIVLEDPQGRQTNALTFTVTR